MLAFVMIVAFFALLFMQVRYMKSSMDMRTQQFNEMVKRSLYNVTRDLEQDQTLRYIEQDMIESESRYSAYPKSPSSSASVFDNKANISDFNQQKGSSLTQENQELSSAKPTQERGIFISPRSNMNAIAKTELYHLEVYSSFSK